MSLLTIALLNLVLAVAVVAGLAAVMGWPLRRRRPVAQVVRIGQEERKLSRVA